MVRGIRAIFGKGNYRGQGQPKSHSLSREFEEHAGPSAEGLPRSVSEGRRAARPAVARMASRAASRSAAKVGTLPR